jgi:serine phosphatase RsbU (regulator of sigma subunit)
LSASAFRLWPGWMAIAAACVGLGILGTWFTKDWPAASWRVLPRAELLRKAREVAQHFGFNATGSKTTVIVSVSKPLARYAKEHPGDDSARTISPLTTRMTFATSQKDKTAKVGLDSAGLPVYWAPPSDFKPAKKYPSEDEAARAVFAFMAAGQASLFSGPVKSMGDEADQEQYVWKKAPASHSDVRERITLVTKDGGVASAERKVYLFSESDDDDSDSGDTRGYWAVLSGIFWTICLPAVVTIFGIYLLWIVRKSLNNRFPGRMAIVAALIIGVAQIAGANASQDSGWSELWAALEILCFVAVGRGISSAARPKWLSLEQLCRLAPVAKATGDSLAAGVFYSPLLTAIPFLIVGCGLFPHSSVAAQNLETLYSPAPILDSGDLSAALCLLGFFGFGVPVLERMVRFRWLRWLIALPLGTAFFAYETHAVNGPLAAALTAGLCTLALFWFLYARFDLLAVLTLQFASGVVLSIFMLAQKGLGIWPLVLALGAVLATAFWFARRGSTVAEGDPLATNPALTGFRAEREKLHAEFSVARRAQQGMLPQASPDIPGYSIAGSCTPSLEVGGDLYDFLKLPDGRIGIGVADVSGKGVPAALYMTLTKGLLASVSKDKSELTSVVEEVNRHLHGVTRKKVFVTMALGFLDAENRIMQCVRAGHNPVVWRQASQGVTTLVAPGGLGLGITVNRVFSSQLKMVEMRLSEGDAVVFYSDGLTEAMNSSLEQFGEERLMEAVERTDQLDAAAAHDSILSTVRTFLDGVHPQDDMTLVVLRVGR